MTIIVGIGGFFHDWAFWEIWGNYQFSNLLPKSINKLSNLLDISKNTQALTITIFQGIIA